MPDATAQDLTWPVFIAGTECYGDPECHRLVEARMEEIMRLSGVLQRPRLLDFLRCLWSLQAQQVDLTWINLARSWAEKEKSILVI
jgi:hypothetical protein